jgi:large repetitive protein
LDPDTFQCQAPNPYDRDDDGVHDLVDNCLGWHNPEQIDDDNDLTGNACDNCPDVPNPMGAPCPATIYDVKTGVIGPGGAVELTGVVTGVASPRFWIQVPELEHHPDLGYRYSGIFIYLSSDNPGNLFIPKRGDYVRVVGDVEDWWGQLEISWVQDVELIESGTPLPDPVMELPANVGTGGEMAEEYEGVLVLIADSEVTELNPPAGSGDTDPTNEYVLDGALRVNDYFHLAEPFPEVGQIMTIMGILRWANSDSKLEPRDEMDIIPELQLKSITPELAFVNEGAESVLTLPPLTVQLNTWAGVDGIVVALESSHPEQLAVPATVTVPPGKLQVEVAVIPLLGDPTPVTITATLADKSVQTQVLVISPEVVPIPIAFSPESLQLTTDGTMEVNLLLDIPGRPGGTIVDVLAGDANLLEAPAQVTVPENEMSVTFEVTGHAPGETTLTASTEAGELAIPVEIIDVPPLGFIITEVYYNSPGGDDGKEWVELFNGTGQAIDLSGYSLGNAGTNYSGSTVQLAGTLAPGQCFVVGGPIADADNGMPDFTQVFDFDPDFQNSGDKADAVALFDVPASQVNNASVPIDAVIYGGSNTNGLIDETGQVNEPDIGNVSAGSTLHLWPDGWLAQPEPTPGDCSHAWLAN